MYNAIIQLTYFPILWKICSIIIVMLKPKKSPDYPFSYTAISLFSIFFKPFKKLILKRLLPFVNDNNIISDSQFGFCNNHSTVHQVYRLVNKISLALEDKL